VCSTHAVSVIVFCSQTLPIAKYPSPHWHVATAKMDGNLSQKEIMGMVHFLGSTTKIM
jgi:hypothetical protein